MLQAIHLKKVYKPKKGVPVTAVDDVSICFPDHGMIFLLGKSGSGKSTLLNLLGGLDKYDSGEIIIKDVSSKDFDQKHFDSYRNTYVGFIFQEYNVLEEFTIGANIALALELQGKKATDKKINRILEEVDLAGCGSRWPGELSGGQKQRVAIARALVKNPKIIMADEPTGALDSKTGRQILETLKRLSKDKLVIVVSHDQAFASRYGDRVIELADGRIIRDVEYIKEQENEQAEVLAYEGRRVTIPENYHLTEADRLAINDYMDRIRQGVSLEVAEATENRRRQVLTDERKIVHADKEPFRLIKSKLSWKNAFKIGSGGLKYKKVRLAVTLILSCVAFGLFALADTFAAYEHARTCANSIVDSNITYASVAKAKKIGNNYILNNYTLGQKAIDDIEKNTGVKLKGVYEPFGWSLSFNRQREESAEFTETEHHIHAFEFTGLTEITQEDLAGMKYALVAGRLPDGTKNEIAVSKYVCETFIVGKYRTLDAKGQAGEFEEISACEEMVGKTILLGDREFTVTGVVDTHLDLSRYETLTRKKENMTETDRLVEYTLYNEFVYENGYSLSQAAIVGKGYLEELMKSEPMVRQVTGGYLELRPKQAAGNALFPTFHYAGALEDVSAGAIVWAGSEKQALGEKEIVVSANVLAEMYDREDAAPQELVSLIKENSQALISGVLYNDSQSLVIEEAYTIVGIIDTQAYPFLTDCVLGNEKVFNGYVEARSELYAYAIGAMPEQRKDIEKLITYCCREDGDVRYELMNKVTYELDMVDGMLKAAAKGFLYAGIVFALFAALMLANFIATSISYKKQEIGILRAIGSRSNDVFRIFFAESFIIAMIIWMFSCAGVGVLTMLANAFIRQKIGIAITILDFGVRQVFFLWLISMAVVAAASFFPVKRIASKRPIDAIRNR